MAKIKMSRTKDGEAVSTIRVHLQSSEGSGSELIDVEATTPEEAMKKARAIQKSRQSKQPEEIAEAPADAEN